MWLTAGGTRVFKLNDFSVISGKTSSVFLIFILSIWSPNDNLLFSPHDVLSSIEDFDSSISTCDTDW